MAPFPLTPFISIVPSVKVGGYQKGRARPGLRAAVNARLEEMSFRTGLITAAIAVVALLAIAAAGTYMATLGSGGPARNVADVQKAGRASAAPATTPPSAPPATSPQPQSSHPPKPSQPVTAGAAISQSPSQSQSQWNGSGQGGDSGYYGHGNSGGGGSPYRGYGSPYGGYRPQHGSPGGLGGLGRHR